MQIKMGQPWMGKGKINIFYPDFDFDIKN